MQCVEPKSTCLYHMLVVAVAFDESALLDQSVLADQSELVDQI